MKKIRLISLAAMAAMVLPVSCSKEAEVDTLLSGEAVPVSLFAFDGDAGKVSLDFEQASNVLWGDYDLIAVFDGQAKREFSVVEGSNTGATAIFAGEAAPGATLYAVYPFDAGNSLSGSNLSVTVPAQQVIAAGECADSTALVSVGVAESGNIAFKQVCGLVKVEISGGGIRKIIIGGSNLAGTATVAADGTVSSVTEGANSVELSYEGGKNFPAGTYYAAVFPGTTPAGEFTVELVNGGGLSWQKSASSAVSVVRRQVIGTGAVDSEAEFVRHIATKEDLYAWGAAMGDESGVTVYLDADINCGADPWKYTTATFDGVFEGQGHCIYNLVIESETKTCFIYRLTGTLKDVIIGSADGESYDNISRITHVGTDGEPVHVAVVSRLCSDEALMENVINFAKVEVPSTSNSRAYIGGLVGIVPELTAPNMVDCKNYGHVISSSTWTGAQTRMGGIVGQCDGTLSASGLENYGKLTNTNSRTNFIGGLCGDVGNYSTIASSYNFGDIENNDGAGSQMTYIGGCFGSVRRSTFDDCQNFAPITTKRNAQGYIGGLIGLLERGESGAPILISNCINNPDGVINYIPAESNKRTIIGGVVGGCTDGAAMFLEMNGCENYADITIPDGMFRADPVGGIAGNLCQDNGASAAGQIRLENCVNYGNIRFDWSESTTSVGLNKRIAGLVGMTTLESGAKCTYVNCRNEGRVSASGAGGFNSRIVLGGITADLWGILTLIGCENNGDIVFERKSTEGVTTSSGGGCFMAGMVAAAWNANALKMTDCVNRGHISSDRAVDKANVIGGLVGITEGTIGSIADSKNYGAVDIYSQITSNRAGGLVGKNTFPVSNCFNFGSVSEAATFAGAVAGENSGVMSDCTVCTDVTVNGEAAGAPGSTPSIPWLCPSNTGSITCKIVAHSSTE
jgi:hypothetical protein